MHPGITARLSPVSGQILSPVETRSRARGFQRVDAGPGTGTPPQPFASEAMCLASFSISSLL